MANNNTKQYATLPESALEESLRLWRDVAAKRERHECFRCGKTNDNWAAEKDKGSDICSKCRDFLLNPTPIQHKQQP